MHAGGCFKLRRPYRVKADPTRSRHGFKWRTESVSEPGIRYFDQPAVEPVEPGRFVYVDALEPVLDLAPGVTSRPLVGSNLLGSFVRYEPHSLAPLHSHVEEQLFVVLEGEIELEMNGERRLMRTGDAALIPAWVPLRAVAVGPRTSTGRVQPSPQGDARPDRVAKANVVTRGRLPFNRGLRKASWSPSRS